MMYACDRCRFNEGYIRPHAIGASGQEQGWRRTYVKCSAGSRTWTRPPAERPDADMKPEECCIDYARRRWYE